MNFQNMEYFLVTAEMGNITRAAQKLQISQQALSNTIARLESELGCRLFERRQGLELTYSGKQYKEAVEQILDIQRQTTALLDDINGNIRGELRIGISYTRGQAILPLILPEFIRKYPLIEFSVLEGSTASLESHLEHGDIDVMIGFAPFMFENAEYYDLMTERLLLVIPKTLLLEHFGDEQTVSEKLRKYEETHDIRLFQDFPFVLLKEGDRIRSITDDFFQEAGVRPIIRFETKNTQTAVVLAAEGIGITVCPELYLHSNYIASGIQNSYIQQRIVSCPLTDASKSDHIAIGYNKDRYLSQIAADFIQMSLQKMGVR